MEQLKLVLIICFLIGHQFQSIAQNEYGKMAQDLLKAIKNEEPYKEIQEKIAKIDQDKLDKALQTDEDKKAFWMNIYNANVQILLTEDPSLFEDRGKFFGEKRVTVAGKELSFDTIEHGIIRGSRSKLTLGLTKKLFVDKFERKFRTKKRDGRIHFALNCGAKSCPYIAVYESDRLNEQLDKGSKKFLQRVSTYKAEEEKVYTTVLFSWFRGDFGCKGPIKFLKKYDVVPEDADPKIKYDKYDWTLDLGNYIEL